MNKLLSIVTTLSLIGFISSCGQEAKPDTHDEQTQPISNRIPIPPTVRRNLGMTFAKAEYRAVTETISVPGAFELLPSAQHHYPLPLTGRIQILVKPLQTIKTGDVLMTIDAPEWRTMQNELHNAKAQIDSAATELIAVKARAKNAQALSQGNNNVFTAQIKSAESKHQAAQQHFAGLIAKAASTTGLSNDTLLEHNEKQTAYWQTLKLIPVLANSAGVVEEIRSSNNTWHESGTEIIHAVNPKALQFHAQALQADLPRLKNGQRVIIRSPDGHNDSYVHPITGTLRIGVSGNQQRRLVDVYIQLDKDQHQSNWLRPHINCIADIIIDGSSEAEELSIPKRAIIQDGLSSYFFRRDPRDPDVAIKTEADVGAANDTWVIIQSGIAEGNEVVIDGIYELKLISSKNNTGTDGGHFHADGSYHEGEH